MPKYIELSSLLEKLQATSIVTDDLYGMGIMSGMDAARKIVAEQPIIDAEPVVRCQYCKHHNEGENYIYCRMLKTKCPNDADFFCECTKCHLGIVRPDDSCEFGERRATTHV